MIDKDIKVKLIVETECDISSHWYKNFSDVKSPEECAELFQACLKKDFWTLKEKLKNSDLDIKVEIIEPREYLKVEDFEHGEVFQLKGDLYESRKDLIPCRSLTDLTEVLLGRNVKVPNPERLKSLNPGQRFFFYKDGKRKMVVEIESEEDTDRIPVADFETGEISWHKPDEKVKLFEKPEPQLDR